MPHSVLARAVLLAVCSVSLVAQAHPQEGGGEDNHGQWHGGGRGGSGLFCGGIAAQPCPEGYVCVDDPRDDCDPARGGADCAGLCRRGQGGQGACTGNEPGLQYISRDPNQCAALLFTCPDGQTPFFNACGCGCQQAPQGNACEDPNRRYVSRDPNQCATIRFICEQGYQPFFDECGCGCQPAQ